MNCKDFKSYHGDIEVADCWYCINWEYHPSTANCIIEEAETKRQLIIQNNSKITKKCDLCGSTENLIGPFAGGPFSWYCQNCHQLIRKWEDAKKKHRETIMKIINERKKNE